MTIQNVDEILILVKLMPKRRLRTKNFVHYSVDNVLLLGKDYLCARVLLVMDPVNSYQQ